MKKIIWAKPAGIDLENIHAYIAQDSLFYADVTCAEIIQSVEKVVEFSKIGRRVPEYDDEYVREVILRDYRIVYEISGDKIFILTVIHGSKLLRRERRL